MSMPRGSQIKCPNCRQERNVTIWHTINVDVNPEIRDKVKTGKIFEYRCQNCQNVFDIEYRFMYHDVNHKFQVWYFPKQEYDINEECININNTDIANKFNERIRIVNDKKRLVEKIMIFEDRLNDIVIEIIKSIISDQVKDENVEIYYNEFKNEEIHFWLSNGKGARIPYSMYCSILNDNNIEEPRDCVNISIDTVFKYVKDK